MDKFLELALSDDGNGACEVGSRPKLQDLALSNGRHCAWEVGSGPTVQEVALSNGGNWAWEAGSGPRLQGVALSKGGNGEARECSRGLALSKGGNGEALPRGGTIHGWEWQFESGEVPEGGIRPKPCGRGAHAMCESVWA